MSRVDRRKFYQGCLEVFANKGHKVPACREMYAELEALIERLLLEGELHIQGLVTVRVSGKEQEVFDVRNGRSMGRKVVVYARAKVRQRLKQRWRA